MFEGLLADVLGSGFLGGLLGTVASLFTKAQDRKMLEVKNAHEVEMAKFEMAERKLEMSMQLHVAKVDLQKAETEAARATDVAAYDALNTSMKVAAIKSGVKWIDALRSLMRPAITTTLLVTYIVMFITAYNISGGFAPESVDDVLVDTVDQLTFLTVTCVLWWFGSRSQFSKR